jgi:hypothetical protein
LATKKILSESLTPDMLARVARDVMAEDYDLRGRASVPRNFPLSGQVAASALVDDAVAEGRFLHLAERLARLDHEGFMGRAWRITNLREIFRGIEAEGYLWDEDSEHFMEDPRIRRTPNWGRLVEGEENRFSLLRVDVVRNSQLVRTHGEAAARDAYDDLRVILARCVEHRSGRIWSWEGDGALAAFLFGHSTTGAVLAGMALLHELFMYDRVQNNLGEPLRVRAAVHTGPVRWHPDVGEIARQETVLEIMEAEARWTPPSCLSVTPAVAPTLDRVILDRFHPGPGEASRLLVYEVRLGPA